VALTSATDHEIRKALAELASEHPSTDEQDTRPVDSSTDDRKEVSTPADNTGAGVAPVAPPSPAHTSGSNRPTTSPASPATAGDGTAVWPIGLMIAVETVTRIRWPEGFGWSLARFGGAGTVALGSAVISYGHLRDVLEAWHYTSLAAAVGPLVLDGLMVVCGFALLANSVTSHHQTPPDDHR
jgi:hypothetical protein